MRAAFVGLLLIGLAGAAGAWIWRPARAPVLDPDWRAVVTVTAGTGHIGVRDGPSSSAQFSDPFGVAIARDGSVVVADGVGAHRIRRVSSDGLVTTVAGSVRGWKDGPGSVARFDTPSGVAVGRDDSVYVADTGNNALRRIAPDGEVTTLAGKPAAGLVAQTSSATSLNGPLGVAVTTAGMIVVADTYNDRVAVVDPTGGVRTLAGLQGVAGFSDGAPNEARFNTPSGVTADALGSIYVADTGNNAVRLISPDGAVSTIGPQPQGGFFRPTGVAVAPSGLLYVTDEGGRVVEIQPNVRARVLAGVGPGFADGVNARFRSPSGVALLDRATLVVTDRRNALMRMVEPLGLGKARPPAPASMRPAFDFDAFALTPLLWPLHPQEGPFEITGTVGEVRGNDREPRFHTGLDIRAPEGSIVRAVRDGTVADPIAVTDFDTLGESLRVGPLVYVHQRVGRSTRQGLFRDPRLAPAYADDGSLLSVRVKRGSRYSVGEPLGTTNAFNHVHLNVGWPREEHNAMDARLVQFADTVAPTLADDGIFLLDAAGQRLQTRRRGRVVVSGPVHIIVDAWDQVNGGRADRRLGLYRLGYQILDGGGIPVRGFEVIRETLRFDRLAPEEDGPRYVYAPGSGIPFYGVPRTRFLYDVTATLHRGVARAGVWDPGGLSDGDYTVRVLAADAAGNAASKNRDIHISLMR